MPKVDLLGLGLSLRHVLKYYLHTESKKAAEHVAGISGRAFVKQSELKSSITTQSCLVALQKVFLDYVELEEKLKLVLGVAKPFYYLQSTLTEGKPQTPLEYRNTCF